MTAPRHLSPLQAYERADTQKHAVGAAFRAKLLALHRALTAGATSLSRPPPWLPAALRLIWPEAAQTFAADPDPLAGYRTIVMRHGIVRIDPHAADFERALRLFHRNYVTNFPLPAEQETRAGFRTLWRASPRDGGYQEVGRSVLCPLTGRYLMGVNFSIQPRSDSVHFIYGFVNPAARGIGGFSALLLDLMRQTGRAEIASWLSAHPADRPAFHNPDGPLILFEKNMIAEMSLTDILRDTAHVDIDHPPTTRSRLVASAISQSLRDYIWNRRGGRIVDYTYLQSSLDGVVTVPDAARPDIVACLLRADLDEPRRRSGMQTLHRCLGTRREGATQLALCAFAAPGATGLPSAQIRLSNAIFQGISVVKDPDRLGDDIYFQAQMTSLEQNTRDGMVGLTPIVPGDAPLDGYLEAERMTKNLLADISWADLRAAGDSTYGDWLRLASTHWDGPRR